MKLLLVCESSSYREKLRRVLTRVNKKLTVLEAGDFADALTHIENHRDLTFVLIRATPATSR